MKKFSIYPLNHAIESAVRHKVDNKTKPVGALGKLEELALQAALIQGTLTPALVQPHLVVFAADHGLAAEGISAYPQEVTAQMVLNFVCGGAAINVFCKQHGINLRVVDAGVNYEFLNTPSVINTKIRKGTSNMLKESAMSIKEAQKCIDRGSKIISDIAASGCNVIAFGEMGIGNTSAASLLTSIFIGESIEKCVGRGTGLTDTGLRNKIDILTSVLVSRGRQNTELKNLATFGGFEIAQMVGAMLQAAELKMILLIDGFIATAAFLVAHALYPHIKEYAIFCHQSDERGHKHALQFLQVEPLLHLNMRLGEGTGAAVAYPLVQSAVNFLNEMASFESAGVSNK
jgi:nicotinate-nucleotide--dimethylbenzimidazole phosphoribosyltransferase